MPPGLAPAAPGAGPGWELLAAAVRDALPVGEVDGIWVFRTMRNGPREFGTAILTRADGDRRRIYTAQYALTIKGRQRGGFEWGLTEVGSGPLEALEELLALVPARGVEEEPPVAVPVEGWFPPLGSEPTDADLVA